MKWLFATLVGLNLIVFAGMIASKIYKQNQPTPITAPVANTSAQPPVVINLGAGNVTSPTHNGSVPTANNAAGVAQKPQPKPVTPKPVTPKNPASADQNAHNDKIDADNAQAKYRNCSAKVSMPEDDYHRIKGLLGRFPHAATRQVVQGGGDGDTQVTARMSVLFMSVSDEEANAIQQIVGRYGTLSRSPCNK